ncbi:HNH endonuclease [Sorangium sp. So ce1153]|uniref:HNH endonuclease n=1 Tax=Sorangium sp. So ce1153 TaxID=3133333 RepID=UPI003F5F5680
MKNIPAYTGDALGLYDDIVEAKQGDATRHATLTRLRTPIAKAYANYERSRTKLETLAAEGKLTKSDRKALFHCYDVETAPLSRAKRDILEALPREVYNKCPYCGLDSTGVDDNSGGEWDHYLPRRTKSISGGYAEFSVHPINLIPCCGACNKRKGDRWRNGRQRIFINFYSDDIDQGTPLLEAHIYVRNGEAEATFEYTRPPFTDFSSLFRRHCEALRLRERYARQAREELALRRGQIVHGARKYGRGADWFLQDFQDLAEIDAGILGINHWKPTLYRAAARSRHFVAHCLESAGIVAAPGPAAGGQGS